ncbi:uncharacterized protein J3R85_015838 [Psidium guajava]|nr:uncharacterized protein J3R85_015838 [Psidium guajava]
MAAFKLYRRSTVGISTLMDELTWSGKVRLCQPQAKPGLTGELENQRPMARLELA